MKHIGCIENLGFSRGDDTNDAAVDITGAIRMLELLILGTGDVVCHDADDAAAEAQPPPPLHPVREGELVVEPLHVHLRSAAVAAAEEDAGNGGAGDESRRRLESRGGCGEFPIFITVL